MALVLKAKTKRNGDIKRLDVVRTAEDTQTVAETLDGIKEGSYVVHTGGKTINADVSYRTVQDVNLS